MKNLIKNRFPGAMLLFTVLCFLVSPALTFSQDLTHTVQKGDTLWGICESYYGDPNLWPKLWEMNPFITNPHLLKEGDVITLFEKAPEKKEEAIKAGTIEAVTAAKEEARQEEAAALMGMDISAIVDVNTRGYLSYKSIDAWGRIFSSESDRLMLIKGDIVYLVFDEGREVKEGDRFFMGASSALLKHPLTGKKMGYAFSVHGILKIEAAMDQASQGNDHADKRNIFKATVEESYRPVNKEDIVVPYASISTCILPVSLDKKVTGNIIATHDQDLFVKQYSMVYVNLGLKDGVAPGNILNIVRRKEAADPNDDRWIQFREKNVALSDKLIGRLIIIESGQEISTAVVISAVEDFSAGAYVTDMSWEKTPDFLLPLLTCPIK